MRFERFVRRYSNTPWAITPTMLDRLCGIIESQVRIGKSAFLDELPPPPSQDTEMRGSIAVKPINGIIDKDIGDFERISGAVDIDEIAADLRRLAADETVSAIVLDFDSPGGTVTGVPELAELVSQISKIKPVVAYTDSLAASAAYWIASGASAFVASSSAEVGSIGVYLPVIDVTRAYESQGVKVDLVKAGDLKAAGYPGTAMSAEQRADLQAGVDHVYERFTNFVSAHRIAVDADAMRGQTLFGDQAEVAGLIDWIGDLDSAVELASSLAEMMQ